MPLDPEVLNQIDSFVRGGFEERERIVETLTEEMYEEDELDLAEVESAVDAAIEQHEDDKRSWPRVTDCDKLDAAFSALTARGIVALQYAGYTQSDGYEDVAEAYHGRADKSRVVGYCFYHGQDLERAVNGDGLHLAFGPIDPKDEKAEGPKVGALVAEELGRAGFTVQWNGTFDQRILIPEIDWKRR